MKNYLKDGVDIVTYSGDKLLGGIQSGLISGKNDYIKKIHQNPMYRTLRCDKYRIALLEKILRTYITTKKISDQNLSITLFNRSIKNLNIHANKIKDLIKDGDVHFITILYEDEFHDNATYDTAYEWYDTYPDDLIPILIDENKSLHSIIRPTGIPAITLLSPKMEIITLSTRGFNHAFDKLLNITKK